MQIENITELKTLLEPGVLFCIKELENSVKKGFFTAWSLGNKDFLASCFYADEYLPNKTGLVDIERIHPNFDLASLTKPLFMGNFLRINWGDDFQKQIQKHPCDFILEADLYAHKKLFNFLKQSKDLKIDDLLSHKSQFIPWKWVGKCFWENGIKDKITGLLHIKMDSQDPQYKDKIIHNLADLLIENYTEKNENCKKYSDLNYMALPLLCENIFQVKDWSLEIEKINQEIGSRFFHCSIHPKQSKFSIPSFPYVINFHDLNLGENFESFGAVHDTNANLFSSFLEDTEKNIVSSHSGFFGNVSDVYKSIQFLKKFKNNIVHVQENQIDRFVSGLDRPTSADSLSGITDFQKYGHKVFGHLGFTGTSFWFAQEDLIGEDCNDRYILLTNRTSARSVIGPYRAPRIFVLSDLKTSQNYFYQILERECIQLSLTDYFDSLYESFFVTEKIWNFSTYRSYPNISEIRREIGKAIWKIK